MSTAIESDDQPLTLGIIGAGGIVRSVHMPGFAAIPGVTIAAVANRHRESAEAFAAEFGIPTVYDDWHDVINDDRVQAVVIGTPPYLHAEATLAALEAGKHVFCQARMAVDIEPALEMLAADRETSLTTMLCPPPHYLAVDAHVRGLFGEGAPIGEVRHVVVEHAAGSLADPDAPLHWRQRHDVNGINALEVGIVAEVLGRWFGPVAEVAAVTRTWTPERRPDADGKTTVDNPDAVSATGTFTSGATLTALFSGVAPHGRPQLTVHGERGSITCWPHGTSVRLTTADGVTEYDVAESERTAWTVERDFVTAVRRGEKGSPSFSDGVRYMAVTRAITDAASSGERVSVREL